MRRSLSVLFAFSLLASFVVPLQAQSVPDEQRAEVAIEIRMDRLRQSPLYDMLKQGMEQARAHANLPGDVDLDDVESVFIAIALPESIADFEAMEKFGSGSTLPMEFYARTKFSQSGPVEAMMNKAREDSTEREINGKTYYAPPADEGAPANLLAHKVDDRTIEVGTENYLTGGTGDHLFSGGLSSAWENTPEAAIRIAIDLDHSSSLINEAVDQAREEAPPMALGFIDLVTKASNVRLTFDLAGDNLLTLGTTGKDEESATELHQGLNGILAMGKMGGQQAVQQLSQQDPDSAAIVKSLLDSLVAKQNGNDVNVVIPKPEGFDAFVEKMLPMAMGAGGR